MFFRRKKAPEAKDRRPQPSRGSDVVGDDDDTSTGLMVAEAILDSGSDTSSDSGSDFAGGDGDFGGGGSSGDW